MFTFQNNNNWSKLIWALVFSVFIADLTLPPAFDIVYMYLLAHFLAIFFREKNDVLLLAVLTTMLTIAGAVIQHGEAPQAQILLERMPPIASFWAAALFVVRFILLRDKEEQQEAKFRALFQYSSNGILMTNKQGVIIITNPSLEKLFGYAPGELIGRQIEVLIPQRLGERHKEHREQYHQQPSPRSMGIGLQLRGLRKDGSEFPVEVSLSPFKNNEGQFTVAFVVDNTFRASYEKSIVQEKEKQAALSAQLQDLNEELENKVKARTAELELAQIELRQALAKERDLGELKSRFVSMASHEFRTPLTTVLSSAGLINQYADRQDLSNIKKHAERIKSVINGLNAILNEFLSLGQIEEGRVLTTISNTDIKNNVQKVLEELRPLLKPGQTFDYQHDGTDAVQTDGALLNLILINLISNAIKYSPENSTVFIQTIRQTDVFRIAVRDQGIGIPESDQKHIFDRFFRASNAVNSTKGTGLGLHIVQRYAEMIGGKIGFESVLDKGSTFWLEIPL
jgi:PAS domain S-box-containing protein